MQTFELQFRIIYNKYMKVEVKKAKNEKVKGKKE